MRSERINEDGINVTIFPDHMNDACRVRAIYLQGANRWDEKLFMRQVNVSNQKLYSKDLVDRERLMERINQQLREALKVDIERGEPYNTAKVGHDTHGGIEWEDQKVVAREKDEPVGKNMEWLENQITRTIEAGK